MGSSILPLNNNPGNLSENDILEIINSKKTFKKINKWLKCGMINLSDADFVKLFSILMMICFTIKITVFLILNNPFNLIPILYTALTFLSIIFLLVGIHKDNVLLMIPFKYIFTLYTVFESIHFIIEIVYNIIQIMDNHNHDTIEKDTDTSQTDLSILSHENVPNKNKINYVIYSINCVIMLLILLQYYIVTSKYIEEMEKIFELEDIARKHEDPKINNNYNHNHK